eukprot:c10817_g1_i1.p1 GENE.c10817_g1_i1~~c10817_g1_i1.p1  ORF type:complete len:684 (+),score=136.37 c10817_g1_i1:63-2054(+)
MTTRLPPAGEKDEVKIKLSTYHDLLRQLADAEQQDPAQTVTTSGVVVKGRPSDGCASMTFEFEIESLVPKWISLPLLPATMCMLSHTVSIQDSGSKDSLLPASFFGVQNGMHLLMINGKGRFLVSCTVESPYENDKKRSVSIRLPKCAHGSLIWSIPENKNWQVTCSPSLSSSLEVNNNITTLKATFAPVPVLTVQWTEFVSSVEEKDQTQTAASTEPEQKGEEILTCEQETSYSVGEGILQVFARFNVSLVHSSRAVFNFALDPRVRVLQVECENMKRWRILDHVGEADVAGEGTSATVVDPSEHESHAQSSSKVLRVELTYAVVDHAELSMSLEMAMNDTSVNDMLLPVMWCYGMSREKALFALEARTNVEVREKPRCVGVTPIDVTELPHRFLSSLTNPLIAFKSLVPKVAVIPIDVIKHQDTEVLVCVVESALFETTVSAEGKVLQRLRLKIRNTQRQYLRIEIPSEHTLWTTMVGDTTLKPAKDADGRVMIPLQKATQGKNESSFVLEMVYLVEVPALESWGTFTLQFARLDIPINIFMVSIYLPFKFVYGRFQGNFESVKNFSTNVSFETNINRAPVIFMQGQERFRRDSRQNISMDDLVNNELAPSGVTRVGVVPVKVNAPMVGKCFRFEKLLVTNEPQTVIVKYKKKSLAPCCFI